MIVALTILWAACLYLAGLGLAMLLVPDRAHRYLSSFAQTQRANLIEATVRLVVGIAFVIAAPDRAYPMAIRGLGFFLAATALAFVVAPDLHRRFAARSVAMVRPFVPLLGLCSIALAGLLAAYLV